jgi:nitrile hydratase
MSNAHHHPHQEADTGQVLSPYAHRVRAIEALLVDKGILTEPEIQDRIAYMESRSPENGARLVARAWVDPAFKARLLSNTKAAAMELGIDTSGPVEFVVVENTPRVHNLIVCTLCSCYPRAILGRPPDWYKSFNYRSRAAKEPRAVMREFGFEPPDGVEVVVHDSTADVRYMVLPMRPPDTEDLREEELAKLVTRDALIGVNVPRAGAREDRFMADEVLLERLRAEETEPFEG